MSRDLFASRKLVCRGCGHSVAWAKREIRRGDARLAVDDYFERPLWLQTRCAGHVLWAYNREHLEFLEAFVRATLRERLKDGAGGWSNRSLASRLPKWIKSARNREAILRGLARLRTSLDAESARPPTQMARRQRPAPRH